MKNVNDFLLGSDPEVMLFDVRTKRLLSAIPRIPGTKHEPKHIQDGAIQHDNVNLEFGIAPAKSEDEWVHRHGSVMRQCAELLRGMGAKMLVQASADFPVEELDCEEARMFGCDPDFDPYLMEANSVPPDAAASNLRTCGGHVHIGSDFVSKDIDQQADTAKVMDIFLGIPSLLLDKDPTSARRRELYGKAGAHRPKSYGVEYRAIGNYWVSHPDHTRLVYRLVRDGLAAMKAGHVSGIDQKVIRNCINKSQMAQAESILSSFVLPLLAKDTRKLFSSCLEMPQVDVYEGWQF
jgi:hypothetical protein